MAKKSSDSRSRVIAAERAAEASKAPMLIGDTSPAKRVRLHALFKATSGNSFENQRARIVKALRMGPLTTFEARRDLDIVQPGARVWELRNRFGHDIDTVMVQQPGPAGVLHKCAMYVLKRV